MNEVQQLLPPSEGNGLSAYFDPHVEEVSRITPVDLHASLAGASDSLKDSITVERRKRAFEGVESLQTILGQKEALEHAKIDYVTGLPNRVAYEQQSAVIMDRKGAGKVALIYFDVNGLKRVNDLGGDSHDLGDEYLRASADAIKSGLRPGDLLFRVGGDELVALLDGDLDEETMNKVAERLKIHFNEEISKLGLPDDLYTGISVGAAVKRGGETKDELQKRADIACEEDKKVFYKKIYDETGKDLRRGVTSAG